MKQIVARAGMAMVLLLSSVQGSLHVSPAGNDAAAGTLTDPTSLTSALQRVASGDTILLRGGTYPFSVQVTIERTNSGTAGSRRFLFAYANEHPILDFSTQSYGTGTNPRGLQIDGSYWHLNGLEVRGSADNGIYISGNGNIVELCVVHGNRDSGLQLGRYSSTAARSEWPSDNLILNCDSYDNYDAPPGTGENADGFACKLTTGPGNVFRGCISRNNIDDGWDLYTKGETGAIDPVVIDQCLAYDNGVLTDGTVSTSGDRNGFKLGGETIAVAHAVTRCVAFGNGKNGFTWNSNPGAILLVKCLAFDNAQGNFKFGDNATPTQAVFVNNVSFWTDIALGQTDKYAGLDVESTNCWWDRSKKQQSINAKGLIVSAADFANSLAAPTVVRRADGSPDVGPFSVAAGSKLVNAGAVPPGTLSFDPGSYYVDAPDLGAVELGVTTQTLSADESVSPRTWHRPRGRAVATTPRRNLAIDAGWHDVSGRTLRTGDVRRKPHVLLVR